MVPSGAIEDWHFIGWTRLLCFLRPLPPRGDCIPFTNGIPGKSDAVPAEIIRYKPGYTGLNRDNKK